MIPGLSNMSYPDRLKFLKLPTLAYRRTCGDMINVFKIIHGGFDGSIKSMLPLSTTGLRGNGKKIYIDGSNKDVRKFNFTMRVRKIWNSLPESIVNAESIMDFEVLLDKHWADQDLLYDDFKADINL